MRVAVLGRTKMLYDTIEYLRDAGHEIMVIGTSKAAPEYSIREEDYQRKAEELQIPFFSTPDINSVSIIKLLEDANADVAVSVNWTSIIGEKVRKVFRWGILNAHCGDLPRYRGNACPNWAIIKGAKEFAISIHFMLEELDSGNVVVKEYYPLEKSMNITDIYHVMEREIPKLFCRAIDKIENGYMGEEQTKDPQKALRCYPRIPEDSIIDWGWACEEIVKVVRATSFPFQGAYTFYGNLKIHILKCEKENYECPCYVCAGQIIMVNKESGIVKVAASDGVIVLDTVFVQGKEFRAADILKSTRIRLNYCLQEEIYALRNRIDELERRLGERL